MSRTASRIFFCALSAGSPCVRLRAEASACLINMSRSVSYSAWSVNQRAYSLTDLNLSWSSRIQTITACRGLSDSAILSIRSLAIAIFSNLIEMFFVFA